MYSCGPPHMDVQEWDDQHEPTYSNYVRTQDVTLKTCRRRWMIGRNGERGSGISALAAWHDDDEMIVQSDYPSFVHSSHKTLCSVTFQIDLIFSNDQSQIFNFDIYTYIYIYIERERERGWLLGWLGLWHINPCRLFNTKSYLYICLKYIWFVSNNLVWFACIL